MFRQAGKQGGHISAGFEPGVHVPGRFAQPNEAQAGGHSFQSVDQGVGLARIAFVQGLLNCGDDVSLLRHEFRQKLAVQHFISGHATQAERRVENRSAGHGSPRKAAGRLHPIHEELFKKGLHGFIHPRDERGQWKFLAAGGALHVGLVAGSPDVQRLPAVGAGQSGARLSRRGKKAHVVS